MRTTLIKAIAVVALAGAFAVAQDRNPPDPAQMVQNHVDFLTKHLSLNAQQQQQATSILTEEANSSKSLHDQMRTAYETLHNAIQKNDSASMEQAANTIGNLTTHITVAHAKAQAALFQTLSPDQQNKLGQMESHHGHGMHGHGMRGHGWAGGPPPGASFK